MTVGSRPWPTRPVVAPPAGWVYAWNYRESLGHVTDGPDEFYAARTDTYPTGYQGMAEFAGWWSAPAYDWDWAGVSDVRLAGGHVTTGNNLWQVELPVAGGTFRFRFGSHTRSPANWGSAYRIEVWDGVTIGSGNLLWAGPDTNMPAESAGDILGNVTTVAQWTANYDTNYQDVVIPQAGCRVYVQKIAGQTYTSTSHLRIEQVSP